MSLVSTLSKVAMGVMLAKGVGKMMGGSQGGGSGGLGGLGGLLGGLGGQSQSSGGGLGDLLGKVAGGQQGGGLGGLGDILGKVAGGQQGGGSLGGLGNILGSLKGGSGGGGLGGLAGMLGGAGNQTGGLGGLLDSLGGAGQSGGGLGDLLNSALQGNSVQATPDQEKQAEIMLRAMINAAKADGQIDQAEQQQIAEHLDDITPDEVALVQEIMREPLDLQGLINQIPSGMEQQAYLMSLLAIDLDSQSEARYLQDLAQGLNLSPQICNNIHEQLGAPTLYS